MATATTSLDVTSLTGSLGATVQGVHLAQLTDDDLAAFHRALLEHQVLFVRDQHLTEDEHVAFASRLGTPLVFPVDALSGTTSAVYHIEDSEEHPPDADEWHTDITWWPEPPKFATLCALDIPEVGGDTLWVSLYDAYDALSPVMAQLCEQLTVHHTPGQHFIEVYQRIHGAEIGALIAEHCTGTDLPLVRTHDETGRRVVFLSYFIDHVVGMHRAESDHLLSYLNRLVDDPNRAVRWRWKVGDVAVWDERCTEHRALSDHYPRHRLMRRIAIEGGPTR